MHQKRVKKHPLKTHYWFPATILRCPLKANANKFNAFVQVFPLLFLIILFHIT